MFGRFLGTNSESSHSASENRTQFRHRQGASRERQIRARLQQCVAKPRSRASTRTVWKASSTLRRHTSIPSMRDATIRTRVRRSAQISSPARKRCSAPPPSTPLALNALSTGPSSDQLPLNLASLVRSAGDDVLRTVANLNGQAVTGFRVNDAAVVPRFNFQLVICDSCINSCQALSPSDLSAATRGAGKDRGC